MYNSQVSGNCYKVRLLLAQLGFQYERREVDVVDRSNRLELLGELNPALRVPTIVLANLVLGENVMPQFTQRDATPAPLAQALAELIGETAARRRQRDAFARLDAVMEIGSLRPSEAAADIVIRVASR